MEDRETARIRKYGESKTTGIMMATVPHVTSGLGLRKFQADGFLLTRVYTPRYMSLLSDVVVIFLNPVVVLTPSGQFWVCVIIAFSERCVLLRM